MGRLSIVKALQIMAGVFVVGTALLVIAQGQRILAVALIGASLAALLWAAAVALTYLHRITQAIEWTALKDSRSHEHDGHPRA